jgi:hypothetical protein
MPTGETDMTLSRRLAAHCILNERGGKLAKKRVRQLLIAEFPVLQKAQSAQTKSKEWVEIPMFPESVLG